MLDCAPMVICSGTTWIQFDMEFACVPGSSKVFWLFLSYHQSRTLEFMVTGVPNPLLTTTSNCSDFPGVKSFTTMAGERPTVACACAAVVAASLSQHANHAPRTALKLFDL